MFVKIVSPNFDLKYGLNNDEIERFKELLDIVLPIKIKKHCLFGQRSFMDIVK